MAIDSYTIKVLEDCRISPPPNSVPPSSLPLTFFDIPWLFTCPMQSIYLYEYPHSTLHFTNTILPMLKHSLSLSLEHFFPLAGTLMCPPHPTKPHILYTEGDSIPFTITESTGNFAHLLNNQPRDVRECHPLVPQLPMGPARATTDESDDPHGEVVHPLLAVQVTVFPNSGICIGFKTLHVAADGRSFNHFMKSWASFFRTKGDHLSSIDHKSLPLHDKSVIKDYSNGLDTLLLSQLRAMKSSSKEDATTSLLLKDKVRATFVMSRYEIERLKHWISTKYCENHGDDDARPFHLSTFVVTCALIWVCLIKSQDITALTNNNYNNESLDEDHGQLHHFAFLADCRNREEIGVPITYFGNCLVPCFASAKTRELVGENGVVAAAKIIGRKIKELESGVLRGIENWIPKVVESKQGRIGVAGSPKLRFYEVDFGWGRPKKFQIIHIDVSNAISLVDCRDEHGGVEVGLALTGLQMDAFISTFEESKKMLCACVLN